MDDRQYKPWCVIRRIISHSIAVINLHITSRCQREREIHRERERERETERERERERQRGEGEGEGKRGWNGRSGGERRERE